MVEMQIEEAPSGLVVAFAVVTTLLVAVHLLALMISTCILPNIEAVSNIHNVNAVHESPHDRMRWYIELAWIFSTGFGILLFLADMAILAWLRFHDTRAAAIAASVIIVPALIVFMIFAIHFYRNLIGHRYERSARELEELEGMASQLETARTSLNHHSMKIV